MPILTAKDQFCVKNQIENNATPWNNFKRDEMFLKTRVKFYESRSILKNQLQLQNLIWSWNQHEVRIDWNYAMTWRQNDDCICHGLVNPTDMTCQSKWNIIKRMKINPLKYGHRSEIKWDIKPYGHLINKTEPWWSRHDQAYEIVHQYYKPRDKVSITWSPSNYWWVLVSTRY